MSRFKLVFLISVLGITATFAQSISPGGGGGGGGGGAVTVADGADVTQGTTTDAASSAGGTGTISAKLREVTALLNSILTGVTSPIPAPAGTPTETSISCGTSSTTLLAASTATTFILIQSPNGDVWVDFSGNTAVLLPPSIKVSAGGSFLWSPTTFLPTTQINCKAASATTVTLMYK